MERLEKESPTQDLSDELKAKLAELGKVFKAKIADREVFLNGEAFAILHKGAEVAQRLPEVVSKVPRRVEGNAGTLAQNAETIQSDLEE